MRIEKVNLPESITSIFGLKEVKMDRLNKVVLIAGKNGAGKSRLLRLIKQEVNNNPTQSTIKDFKSSILSYKNEIDNYKKHIKNAENQLIDANINTDTINRLNNDIKSYNDTIESYNNQISNYEKTLNTIDYFSFDSPKESSSLVDFVPQKIELRDSYTESAANLDSYANQIYIIGTSNISEGTIPAIEKIQRSWINVNTVTSNDINISEEEKNQINEQYEKLKSYVKLFLNTELKRTKEGYPALFNKRIGEAQLSNGQKILLQFCMALFAQEVNLEKLVIFMDEPENHLHPAALIDVLEKIIPHINAGQLWIATHSINVLSHFDPSSIWYIDNGEVSYAGNVPQNVLSGLLGSEEEIEKLSNFLSLPAQMASTRFAFESLFYPDVVITGNDDPQVNQIHNIIKERAGEKGKLKVLDFGMGKGRLLSTIYENERLRESDITSWLDFYGYDKFNTNQDMCNKVLSDIYGVGQKRYFSEFKDLHSNHDENTFDVIVMCNVFHEIDPNEWLNLFTSVIAPFKLLKDDGYLLIVEDQLLAIGENAHSKGFLVFDELELKKLFKITSKDNYQSTDYRKDGRLKSHHISKSCLERIDAVSKKESLAVLIENSKNEMKRLRKEPPSFKNGKLHGFWAQQLANASLAIEEL